MIGDPLYGSGYKSKINKLNEDVQSHFKPLQNRQALHAYLLGFEHPRTGKILKYKEEPPYDMMGNGAPTIGSKPSTIDMLTAT